MATGVLDPMEELRAIESDLRRKKIAGMVVFDLLLAHGNKINRYFVGNFDGAHFSSARLESAQSDYDSYCVASAKILQKNLEKVDASLLTQAMRYALSKGIPF